METENVLLYLFSILAALGVVIIGLFSFGFFLLPMLLDPIALVIFGGISFSTILYGIVSFRKSLKYKTKMDEIIKNLREFQLDLERLDVRLFAFSEPFVKNLVDETKISKSQLGFLRTFLFPSRASEIYRVGILLEESFLARISHEKVQTIYADVKRTRDELVEMHAVVAKEVTDLKNVEDDLFLVKLMVKQGNYLVDRLSKSIDLIPQYYDENWDNIKKGFNLKHIVNQYGNFLEHIKILNENHQEIRDTQISLNNINKLSETIKNKINLLPNKLSESLLKTPIYALGLESMQSLEGLILGNMNASHFLSNLPNLLETETHDLSKFLVTGEKISNVERLFMDLLQLVNGLNNLSSYSMKSIEKNEVSREHAKFGNIFLELVKTKGVPLKKSTEEGIDVSRIELIEYSSTLIESFIKTKILPKINRNDRLLELFIQSTEKEVADTLAAYLENKVWLDNEKRFNFNCTIERKLEGYLLKIKGPLNLLLVHSENIFHELKTWSDG